VAEYHVGCGIAGIYAGVLKNKEEWKDKTECTNEAIVAVRDYMIDERLGGINGNETSGGYQWKLKDGRTVQLVVKIIDELNPFPENSNAC
jgi:hypothetical protein